MLFDKRTKKVIKYTWAVVGFLLIVSMIMAFSPSLWK